MTASHNPAKYNGYKAYGPDGCQMTDDAAAVSYTHLLYVPTVVMRYNTSSDKERIEAKNITIMMQRWKNVYENQYGYSS